MSKTNLTSETSRKIWQSHKKDEIFSAIVYGERGVGKSSFCLKILYDLYHNGRGMDYKDAWMKALNQTINGREELAERASKLRKEDRKTMALHMDDVGQWFTGDLWQRKGIDRNLLYEIRDLMPVMRTRSSCNLYSCDDPTSLETSIKNRPHKIIKIMRGGDSEHERPRTARIYSQDVYPSLTKRIDADELWTHKFDAMLPDWFYKKYNPKRKEYADKAIQRIEDKRNERDEEDIEEKYSIEPEQAAYAYLKVKNNGGINVTYSKLEEITGVKKRTIRYYVTKLRDDDEVMAKINE